MLNCQIDFPDSQVSPAVKDKIMDEIEALNDRYGNITTCHVSVRILINIRNTHFFIYMFDWKFQVRHLLLARNQRKILSIEMFT